MVKKIKTHGNSTQWKVALRVIDEYENFIHRSGSRLDMPSKQSVLDCFDNINYNKSKKYTVSHIFRSSLDDRNFGYLLCRRYQLLITLSIIPRLKVNYLKECEENEFPIEIRNCISAFRDTSINSAIYRFKYINCVNDVKKKKNEEIERRVNFLIGSNIDTDIDKWSDKQISNFLHLSVSIATNEETSFDTIDNNNNNNNIDSLSSFIDSHKSRAFEIWLSVKASNPGACRMLQTRIPLFQALAFTYTMIQPFYVGESKDPQSDKDIFRIMNIFSNYVPSNCRLDGFMNSKLIKKLLK